MRVVYFDFGETRIAIGSAAALSLRGHDVYVIVSKANVKYAETTIVDVEIGTDRRTRRTQVTVIDIPSSFSSVPPLPRTYENMTQLKELVFSIEPEALIIGSYYWLIGKNITKHLKIPLILWEPSVPQIFKVPIFVKYGRVYRPIIKAPLDYIYHLWCAKFSDYIITNDTRTSSIFRKSGIKNIKTVFPTYARYLEKEASLEFLENTKKPRVTCSRPSTEYVLSLITPSKYFPSYNIELKALNFIKAIATQMPGLNFVVIGTSIEDVENPSEYSCVENLNLIGKIWDDSQISLFYRDANCVLCPIYIPGFSNRVMEAFFYGKVVISTTLVNKYHEGLKSESNVIFADTPTNAIESIKNIISKEHAKQEFEKNARQYYLDHFSPELHGKSIEQLLKPYNVR